MKTSLQTDFKCKLRKSETIKKHTRHGNSAFSEFIVACGGRYKYKYQ